MSFITDLNEVLNAMKQKPNFSIRHFLFGRQCMYAKCLFKVFKTTNFYPCSILTGSNIILEKIKKEHYVLHELCQPANTLNRC